MNPIRGHPIIERYSSCGSVYLIVRSMHPLPDITTLPSQLCIYAILILILPVMHPKPPPFVNSKTALWLIQVTSIIHPSPSFNMLL